MWKKVLKKLGVLCLAALLFFFIVIWRLIATAPDIDSITVSPEESATYICDQDGNYIRKLTLASSNRDIITLAEIPDSLQKAFVSIEDERFYEHNGIDIRGILRAFWTGISSGSFSEGASTITQQLIKNNVFTEWTQENSFWDRFSRKVQEQYLAIQLEERISKEEILEDYLNTINLGSGCYGVQSAARRYFGKDASELTLSESAVLASIPQNPSGYDPINYPEANQRRRSIVLDYMEQQGYISDEERLLAKNDDVYSRILTYNANYEDAAVYSYYEDALIEQVISDLMTEKGYSQEQAYRAVYSGGLRIFSAQDPALQQICDEEFLNPANYPEGTEFGVDYALSITDAAGEVTHYSSEMLRSYVRQTLNPSFDLICSSEAEAQGYADAFRQHILDEVNANARQTADPDTENTDSPQAADPDGENTDSPQTADSDDENTDARQTADPDDQNANARQAADSDAENTDSPQTADPDDENTDSPQTATVLAERLSLSPQPQASLVLMDQYTGCVRAIVGGRGEKTASLTLNRATGTTRQPGSTFKILTAYAPALDTGGQTLATTYENEPYAYADGTPVSNWDVNDYSGTVTIREAITRSINVIAVKCITEITPRTGFDYARTLGISTLHETYETSEGTSSDIIQPLALGGITQGVTNLELCAAYAAIAGGGAYIQPKFYTQILDRHGEMVLNNESSAIQVLSDSTSFLLTSAMEDVVSDPSGTAYGAISAAGQPVAGKTGTTSDYKDIWFAGYTPYYTCCVWGGYDNNQALPLLSTYHVYNKVLWSAVMNRIHEGLPAADFQQPDTVVSVTLCRTSHLLAQPGICPDTYTEYFATGTQPTEACTLHEPEPETEPNIIFENLLQELESETESESDTEPVTEESSDTESESASEEESAGGTEAGTEGESDTETETQTEESDTETNTQAEESGTETNTQAEESGTKTNTQAEESGTKTNTQAEESGAQEQSGTGSNALNMGSAPEGHQPDTSSLTDLMNRLTGP